MQKLKLSRKETLRREAARTKENVDKELFFQNLKLRDKLREARLDAGMTQAEAARHFGRDQSFISKIENGIQFATYVEVERLLAIYRKSLSTFGRDD
jgi:DNA-binding XRE family transcriptional regulator